ncbi:FG-GAP-like repeat-containing protein, partial [Streptomyces termitum]
MARPIRPFLLSLATVTALTATGTLAGLVTAPAAQATSSAGGTITRSEVLARAQSWVDEKVPYNQQGYKTDANGTYREDCSGFVSMAWHLKDSLTTWTLPGVSSQIGFSSLKPGDALNYDAQHVFLFAGWKDKTKGDFTYYANSNTNNPTHGPTPANINSSSLEGWPTSYYVGLRYDNIVDDRTQDLTGDGKADIVGLQTDGTLVMGEGNGNGFSNYHEISSGYSTMKGRLYFADVTGDGKADILGLQNDGSIAMGEGNGNGFSNIHTISSGYGGMEGRLYFADVTGDGKADILGLQNDGSIAMGQSNG